MKAKARSQTVSRLNRIAGQIAGLQRMVRKGRACLDIPTQISAVRSALDALGVELLTDHLRACVLGQDASQGPKRAKPMDQRRLLAEVQAALAQFLK